MKKCIWCLQQKNGYAKEHIIPEALGCPKGFIFDKGEVCKSCNNKLGHLDRIIIDDFDIITFQNNVRRKQNKKPFVNSRGNLTAGYKDDEKFIFINMDTLPTIDPVGKNVTKFRKESVRDVEASLTRKENEGTVSFEVSIGTNDKFVRGIYKIAFAALAYFIGSENVLVSKYDSIRNFVINGEGNRFILLTPSADKEFKHEVWPPYMHTKTGDYLMVCRIAMMVFYVDLSGNGILYPELYKVFNSSYGDKGWSYLPITP